MISNNNRNPLVKSELSFLYGLNVDLFSKKHILTCCLLHGADNDGFVIPSLSVEESDLGDWETSRASDPQPPPKVTF
jgi:hypothetical protein